MKNPTENFMVRLPPGMRDRIFEASQLYRRSMNSEIVARLDQSLSGLPDQQFERAIAPPFFPEIERLLRGDLTPEESDLVRCFRRMSAEQRKALLELLG
jgi:hypothetical protein